MSAKDCGCHPPRRGLRAKTNMVLSIKIKLICRLLRRFSDVGYIRLYAEYVKVEKSMFAFMCILTACQSKDRSPEEHLSSGDIPPEPLKPIWIREAWISVIGWIICPNDFSKI